MFLAPHTKEKGMTPNANKATKLKQKIRKSDHSISFRISNIFYLNITRQTKEDLSSGYLPFCGQTELLLRFQCC